MEGGLGRSCEEIIVALIDVVGSHGGKVAAFGERLFSLGLADFDGGLFTATTDIVLLQSASVLVRRLAPVGDSRGGRRSFHVCIESAADVA